MPSAIGQDSGDHAFAHTMPTQYPEVSEQHLEVLLNFMEGKPKMLDRCNIHREWEKAAELLNEVEWWVPGWTAAQWIDFWKAKVALVVNARVNQQNISPMDKRILVAAGVKYPTQGYCYSPQDGGNTADPQHSGTTAITTKKSPAESPTSISWPSVGFESTPSHSVITISASSGASFPETSTSGQRSSIRSRDSNGGKRVHWTDQSPGAK